ncbi:MAG: hypothetical protein H7Z19_19655 [Chitinophagaceae bacterium]|nr:hypothetical protein [Rubrivivax sp.]
MLRADGTLLLIDLAPHARADVVQRHAHRWAGFDDSVIGEWLLGAGCTLRHAHTVAGPMAVRLWAAQRLPIPIHPFGRSPEPALEL